MKVSSPDRRVGMSNALAEAAVQLSERPMLVDSPNIVGLNQRRTQVLIVCNGDTDMEVFIKLFKRRIASPFYRPSVWNFHRLRHEMTVGFDGLIDIASIQDDGKTATISVSLEKEMYDDRGWEREPGV